jgi:hypothetical protein
LNTLNLSGNRCKEKKMDSKQQELLDMYHPAFRNGYQNGRKHAFREKTVLIDKHLVECLQDIFQEVEQEEANDREEGVYYAVGNLIGQISTRVLPRQPHEDYGHEQQEAFLLSVTHKYGAAGASLAEMIRQHWASLDQLALVLDADTFEQMLTRGTERGSL